MAAIPRLVFEEIDQNNEAQQVKPDKRHVFEDDYHTYEGATPKTSSQDLTKYDDAASDDINDLKSKPKDESVVIEDGIDRNDTVCSISKLNETDYAAVLSRSRSQEDLRNLDDAVFMPSLDFSYDDQPAIQTSPPVMNDPFYPTQNLGDDKEEAGHGGLWFKGHSPLPSDESETEDLAEQCDKILTFEHEFALPIICQPFVEKQERINRSFGEKDFSRHRKSNQSSHSIALLPHIKKHHKSHKHKHAHKDKENIDHKDDKEDGAKNIEIPKEKPRPRSATFNTVSALAFNALSELADQNCESEFPKLGMKHSRSATMLDTAHLEADVVKRKPDAEKEEKKHRHRHHHKKHHHARHLKNKGLTAQDTLESRIRSGMHALEEERKALKEIVEEMDENIGERDREDITSHRFGRFHQQHDPYESINNLRPRRHNRSGMLTHVSDLDTVSVCSARPAKPHMHIDMENTLDIRKETIPGSHRNVESNKENSGFVELEELTTTETNELRWKEKARWIKFEEDIEKNERWGKPHVASLSFQALLELRRGLERGTVLLGLDNFDLPTIFESVVENLIITDQIQSSMREKIIAILLSKHCHHHQNKAGILRRKSSTASMSNSDKDSGLGGDSEMDNTAQNESLHEVDPLFVKTNGSVSNHLDVPMQYNGIGYDDDDEHLRHEHIVKFAPITEEPVGDDPKTESDVKERIPVGAEATSVLVATVEDLERPAMAFVRLSKGCFLRNLTEVSIPVRFLFVIMGPPSNHDYFEIGRSIATLMSDKIFHDLAYSAKKRDDILAAINSFLDDSIVLAPGDWDRHLLLPLLQAEISEKRRERIKLLKEKAEWEDPDEENPLERTGHLFGGLKREIKKKIKFYKSDFRDGLNMRCMVSVIFVFFATFAPTITFGALLEKKTGGNLGVMETLLATSLSGILFGLFAGQPLMIVGTTGPILVFEQATYDLSEQFDIEFLTWRVWIGVWVMLILWVVVAFEGCYLVEHFTRFTEEVFSVLISILFMYEAAYFLTNSYKKNPLTKQATNHATISFVEFNCTNSTNQTIPNTSDLCEYNKPNVALISTLLLIGTFFIAYYLRKLRVSHFLSSRVRRVLSDFGVPFAMVLMVCINMTHDVDDVPKLIFHNGLEPTLSSRETFFVNPFKGLSIPFIFVAIFPALCVSILLFMETELTGVLLNKRKNKLRKGGGYNMDLFLMAALCGACSLLGLPWMCAATVRSVQHQNALAVMSRSHAPGEKPYLLRIHEQRLTNVLIHILIGLCAIAYIVIEEIPLAVCFGVVLYLGISSLSGIQFIEQLQLIFVPSKYHPNRKYIRNVKYATLVWYTMIQVACLIILIIVKLSPIAPAFPFVIIGMVFLRRLIERYFMEDELEDLDNEDDGDFDDYDEYGGYLPC